MAPGRIVVVGAANLDLISYVPRLPSPGETLHGDSFQMGFGGKGANQAVMAARLGSTVSLVTMLGTDVFGDGTLDNLAEQGVDTTHVHRTDAAFSGVAPIAVQPDGANAIIIVTGANDHLDIDAIEQARPAIAGAEVVVCQLELPLEITLAALSIAREEGVTTVLNPAPARSQLPEGLFHLADVLCPNEPETELLTGMSVASTEQAVAAAQQLRGRGAGTVVLTLGARGCLVVDDEGASTFDSDDVEVVDTTGAGDAFVGGLAHLLAGGADVRDAAARASRIAAISVTGRGTQTSFPSAADLPAELLRGG
ncbi:MAG: ribokinase [Nitriliruptoraceae bacterium]